MRRPRTTNRFGLKGGFRPYGAQAPPGPSAAFALGRERPPGTPLGHGQRTHWRYPRPVLRGSAQAAVPRQALDRIEHASALGRMPRWSLLVADPTCGPAGHLGAVAAE